MAPGQTPNAPKGVVGDRGETNPVALADDRDMSDLGVVPSLDTRGRRDPPSPESCSPPGRAAEERAEGGRAAGPYVACAATTPEAAPTAAAPLLPPAARPSTPGSGRPRASPPPWGTRGGPTRAPLLDRVPGAGPAATGPTWAFPTPPASPSASLPESLQVGEEEPDDDVDASLSLSLPVSVSVSVALVADEELDKEPEEDARSPGPPRKSGDRRNISSPMPKPSSSSASGATPFPLGRLSPPRWARAMPRPPTPAPPPPGRTPPTANPSLPAHAPHTKRTVHMPNRQGAAQGAKRREGAEGAEGGGGRACGWR